MRIAGLAVAAWPWSHVSPVAAQTPAEHMSEDMSYMGKMRAAKVEFNPMSAEDLARNVARTIRAPKSVIERHKAVASGE